MNFQPLTTEHLSSAQAVAAGLFPWEHEHQDALPAALHPSEHRDFYTARRLASVRCWTAHLGNGPTAGIATLYGYEAQPQELWLAWFGLVENARGAGRGRRFLDSLISLATAEGRHALRLWTTDEPDYARATLLYTQMGFVSELYPALPGEDWKTLVFSRPLNGCSVVPWSRILDRGELCGRETPVTAAAAA